MVSLWRTVLSRLKEKRRARADRTLQSLTARYQVFRSLLDGNNRAIDMLSELDMNLRSKDDLAEMRPRIRQLVSITGEMAGKLDYLVKGRQGGLPGVHHRISARLDEILSSLPPVPVPPHCLTLEEVIPQMRAEVGNKAAALARLKNGGGYPVPDGFVVTLSACRTFLRYGGLRQRIAVLLMNHFSDGEVPADVVAKVRREIDESPLPGELSSALTEAGRKFFTAGLGLAVRSSSQVEDGRHHSFAGQFTTVLNVVDEKGLEVAFRKVVASAFSRRSLVYRRQAGLDMFSFDLAVLCLEMIPSRAAGVLLTRSAISKDDSMLVSALFGLGEAAVSGSSPVDLYFMDRSGRLDERRSKIAEKTARQVCLPSGGIGTEPVEANLQREPAVSAADLAVLAQWGRTLEELDGSPQDIEWSQSQSGKLFLLQSRPQILRTPPQEASGRVRSLLSSAVRTSGGRATGMVHLVRRRSDLDDIPKEPVILVMHQSLPDAAAAIGSVCGILVDLGNPTDHLSLVAREKGIPMLSGLGDGTSRFASGTWLTVDGDAGTVAKATEDAIGGARRRYDEGQVRPPVPRRPADPVTEAVRRLIVPLNLTDAFGPTFTIAECSSLHDIVRYVHEKAVLAMFTAGDDALEGGGVPVQAVDINVPFLVNIIDLGGGLAPSEKRRRRVPPADIQSVPFRALLEGITTPGLRWGPAGAVNIGSVMSHLITDGRSARPIGLPNYAIISRDYLSLNARMDFHFTMIDTVCGPVPRGNYVRFRFKGGGTLPVQRERRALCIATILEGKDFFTFRRGDLVNASLQGVPEEHVTAALSMLGRLLGFTRLLDAVMRDDASPERIAKAFMEGDYGLESEVRKEDGGG